MLEQEEESEKEDEEYGEIMINRDSGRLVRPLLVLNDGKVGMTSQMVDDLQANRINFQDLLN